MHSLLNDTKYAERNRSERKSISFDTQVAALPQCAIVALIVKIMQLYNGR